jgi:hypothetical protein
MLARSSGTKTASWTSDAKENTPNCKLIYSIITLFKLLK